MQNKQQENFMMRCLDLAKLGAGQVAPNPTVGAVLVHNDTIIGEGYHRKYGESHAEVNCFHSVKQDDIHLISESVLYVSLEPCAHYGKTPPCTDLIIQHKVPKVIIGCRDIFSEVNGKGIERLKRNGIEVVESVLENECKELNKRFFKFHTTKQPYIILKWAETNDKKIASEHDKRLLISNDLANRLVHKWRAEEAGILIGTNTARKDNPELTNRLWNGNSPVRLVIDLNLRLSNELKLFNNDASTVIFNLHKMDAEFDEQLEKKVYYYQVPDNRKTIPGILKACYRLNIQSILVEGGGKLLQSFINENLWDEARVITNTNMQIGSGLQSPELINAHLEHQQYLNTYLISVYKNRLFL